jgi:hypothetical protein
MMRSLALCAASLIVGAIATDLVLDPRRHTDKTQEAVLSETLTVYCESTTQPERYIGATALGARIAMRSGLGPLLAAEVAKCRALSALGK